MNTTLITPSGYTSSMQNLINIARKARAEFPNNEIVLLGGLLNADNIKRELNNLGVSLVDIPYQGFYDYIKNVNSNTVIITSPYGCDQDILKLIKKMNLIYFDGTSSAVKKKIDFINNSKGKFTIIYIGNVYSSESSFLSKEAKFSFITYDVNDAGKAKEVLTSKKINSKKTHVIYQSEIFGEMFNSSLNFIKSILPEAVIEDEISDENFKSKKDLKEIVKDGDVVIFACDNKVVDKSLLDYYQISTKNLLYACVKSPSDCMLLNIPSNKNVVIFSDGSLPPNLVNDIYDYFNYKSLWASVPEINK